MLPSDAGLSILTFSFIIVWFYILVRMNKNIKLDFNATVTESGTVYYDFR